MCRAVQYAYLLRSNYSGGDAPTRQGHSGWLYHRSPSGWASQIRSAINAIEGLKIRDIKSISDDDLQLLEKLRGLLDERIDDRKRLSSTE